MSEKIKLFLITIGVAAIFSTGSFVAGREITHRQILSSTTNKEEPEVNQSTDIAIVNQDMGVDYNGKNVNYAEDLIKSVDSDFVLTNREAAKKGLEDGRYGAMIVLPGNFSKNITTINDVTPSRVEIYYEENKALESKNKLIVSAKISDFEKKLNSKLSYMYVSSVFSELHRGQDSVNEILQNDDEDLEALNSINNFDILQSINLTQLEDQDINIENLDLNKNFSENKEIIEQIDTLYRDRLLAKEKSFDEFRGELLNVIGNENVGIKSFRKTIEDMTPEQLKEALTKTHTYNYSSLSSDYNMNIDEVSNYIEEFTKEGGLIDNLASTYKHNILAELDNNAKSSINKINENIEETIKITNNSIDTIEKDQLNNLNSVQRSIDVNNNDPILESLRQEATLYGDIVSELIISNPDVFESAYKNAVIRNNVSHYNLLLNPDEGMRPGNTFSDWNTLKTYIINNSTQDSSFITNRMSKYKKAHYAELENDVKLVGDSISSLKNVKDELMDLLKSTENLRNNSEYKYLGQVFDSESEKTIDERLKLNEQFVDEIKLNMLGQYKEDLLKIMEENNSKIVDDTKEKVEKEVEQVIIAESPIDVNKVLEIFDKNYMMRFSKLLEMTDNIDKTELSADKDAEVSKLWKEYDNKNNELNDLVKSQIDQYDEAFIKITENADNHIITMQEDLDAGIESAQQQVEESLENAKNTKIKSSNSNREKLNSFSNVLTNTRVGTVENSDIYDFIINPVSKIKTQNLAVNIEKPTVNNKYKLEIVSGLILVICASIFITTIGMYALYKKLIIKK